MHKISNIYKGRQNSTMKSQRHTFQLQQPLIHGQSFYICTSTLFQAFLPDYFEAKLILHIIPSTNISIYVHIS